MVTTVRERQDEFLSTLRRGQEIALDGLKVLVETVEFMTPERRPAPHVRLADRLPAPHDVVADANYFAEHLLANQRRFADEVITAISPLLPGKMGTPEGKPIASGEAKPAASRAAKPATAA